MSDPGAAIGDGPRPVALPAHEAGPLFLFSVDLEDVRTMIPDGLRYRDRVVANTEAYLDLLARHGAHCTFYTTGDVARRYPELIGEIVAAGHEIGCHTSDHVPLDRQTPESFRDDTLRCLDAFAKAGAERCIGFRAPVGSLIESTAWAYAVLRELGFTYSSSVLPTSSPLYGWPGFGPDLPQRVEGLWEIPTSLSHLPGLNVPFAGGVYFRVLPFPLVRALFRRRLATGYPVFGYVHPYDVDTGQERFMHPEINGSRFYNWLLFYNRRGVIPRLEKLLANGYRVMRFDEYVTEVLDAGGTAPPTAAAGRAAH